MTLIRRRVDPDQWQPIDVDALEPNALEVVRSSNNRSVIAGPGSGKTELLAQRAAYLLQTGVARTPRRILAISFKRDAAFNLAARVRARCHPDHAHRFDSLTFDAFAKGLVDRFGQALPAHYRPTADYEVANANDRTYRDYLAPLTPPAGIGKRADIIAISVKDFERRWLLGAPLCEEPLPNPSPGQWAAEEFWRSWLRAGPKSFLTFAINAQRTPLFNNYRSSPDLVRIQDVLAKALDAKATTPVSKTQGTISGDSCAVWDFSSAAVEADRLADFVAAQMQANNLEPRDFAILVRQKAGDYMKLLQPSFAKKNLNLRNEAAQVGAVALQELLGETLSEEIIALLRLFTSERAGRHWTVCLDSLCGLRGLSSDDDTSRAKVVASLNNFEKTFKRGHPSPITSLEEAEAIVTSLIAFIGRPNILAASPAYRQGDWFDKVKAAIAAHLEASSGSATSWSEALDVYEGLHAVPLMTIHKSKGLEYHTVIFVGLDDDAWWSFANDKQEATAGFFVAFTRAKQRVIFSYCASRGNRTKIADLYNLLTKAGVKTLKIA